jgi:hypothetical protein
MSKDIVNLIANISFKDYIDKECVLEQYRYHCLGSTVVRYLHECVCVKCGTVIVDCEDFCILYKACEMCGDVYCNFKSKCKVHNVMHQCAQSSGCFTDLKFCCCEYNVDGCNGESLTRSCYKCAEIYSNIFNHQGSRKQIHVNLKCDFGHNTLNYFKFRKFVGGDKTINFNI